ncbi:MAG: Tol-Pal system protein TolB, partial [Desulfobacterales bacterium]|nr:Tol-Pal system protein TolB [Desulfobacterales bacterium]
MKSTLKYLFATILWISVSYSAHAALTIEITSGVEGALPIAVVPFDTSKLPTKLKADISAIVSSDLNRSGVLKVMDNTDLPSQ